MFLVPLALAVGATIGLFLGGVVDRVRAVRVAYWQVAAAGIVLAIGTGGPWGAELSGAAALVAGSLVLLAGACLLNLHFSGIAIVLLGIALNLVALALNGHIAVDPAAIVNAGIVPATDLARVELGAGRAYQDADTLLPVLGAVIPIRMVGEVVSFGDLIVMVGLVNVGFRVLLPIGAHSERADPRSASADGRGPTVIDLTSGHDLPQIPPRPITTIAGEADHSPRVET
ncbi:MAG: DUF5317 family protein [Actinomycetota bacterium]|nr:DUF5317 family protein [Actinomycetota bacterium]